MDLAHFKVFRAKVQILQLLRPLAATRTDFEILCLLLFLLLRISFLFFYYYAVVISVQRRYLVA